MNNDNQIIKACLKGNQSAFKTLYDKYQAYCYTICIRYGISKFDVKDCMQIVFMQLFKSLKTFNPDKAQFKTWMTRICINQILMFKRKYNIQYDDFSNEKIIGMEETSPFSIEAKMDKETIILLLSKMPTQYITVFNLFIIDGYSHKEIAAELGISESKSRVLLFRGRSWAMERLQKQIRQNIKPFRTAL